MAGLVEAERAATAADVAGAYRVLLGRDVESPAVLREKTGQPLEPMVAGLLASGEFTDGVIPTLTDGRQPGDRFAGAPLPADAAWVREALPVTDAAVQAVARAATWRDLLLALYADPRFGPALDATEPEWDRRRLVAGLNAWEPRRPDAGVREDDWGETIAEREAAMMRDAAERLRLDPVPPPPGAGDAAPLFTVLTPVYDPPLEFLARCIDSVRSQTLADWELVLVDDGSTRPTVRSLLQAYGALDPRIRVVLLEENGGISAASNAGLEIARGRWLALLDNDDMLTRDALELAAAALAARPDADLLYSDEVFIGEDDDPQELFPKPDWSPLLMLNGHYIGHLTVHRTALVRELGGFRPAYDFSQDYDLALRVADDRERMVVHLDRIVYAWRRLEGSAAAGGKPYARRTNVAALQDALNRRGWGGFAEALPTANRARRRASPPPPVAIVVPSDSAENITAAVRSITERTWYEAYEVYVVTTSALAARLRPALAHPRLRWVPYDRPFNFSDKCNVGARAAAEAGARFVCFFNDDVRVLTPDWIEALLEVATLPGVGAVSPKLLYEDGRVQHAGMVTGVRRLVGTAFHMRPADSHDLQNLGVQSVREVSLLCAALVLLPLEAFQAVDGFDAVDFPVAHSDVDLCLRLREHGFSLVYTPHATLEHIGHVSIGAEEAAVADGTGADRRPPDKADIALLRRFSQALARDPYFPEAVRGLHHRDSEPRFHLHPATAIATATAPAPAATRSGLRGRDVLILSNELTGTGAPKIVLDMARDRLAAGDVVVVVSRRGGSMLERLTAAGATVIVDSALFDAGDALLDFGRNFDLVLANTAVTWPAVALLASVTDVRWYFHEVAQIDRMAAEQPGFAAALHLPRELWAGSALSAEALARHGAEAIVVPYGVDDRGRLPPPSPGPLRVGVFGTYELRKGQDLALAAWRRLPPELRKGAELHLWGRVLEERFHAELAAAAACEPDVALHGELAHGDYLDALAGCDIVWVPSRDDTLPLVSLDALAAGRVLACSRRVGTAAHLVPGVSGLVARAPEPDALAASLAPALADDGLRARLGAAGRAVFEREFTHAAFAKRLDALLRPGATPAVAARGR